jgi:hypothetical protein
MGYCTTLECWQEVGRASHCRHCALRTAIVFDCGTTGTRIRKFSFVDKNITMVELARIQPLTDFINAKLLCESAKLRKL